MDPESILRRIRRVMILRNDFQIRSARIVDLYGERYAPLCGLNSCAESHQCPHQCTSDQPVSHNTGDEPGSIRCSALVRAQECPHVTHPTMIFILPLSSRWLYTVTAAIEDTMKKAHATSAIQAKIALIIGRRLRV